MRNVNRFWQDAASVFETATTVADGSANQLAILVDERHGLRILDGAGWTADALRREYNATTAYTVTRSHAGVVVEGKTGSESCRIAKNSPQDFLAALSSSIPHHLVRPNLYL